MDCPSHNTVANTFKSFPRTSCQIFKEQQIISVVEASSVLMTVELFAAPPYHRIHLHCLWRHQPGRVVRPPGWPALLWGPGLCPKKNLSRLMPSKSKQNTFRMDQNGTCSKYLRTLSFDPLCLCTCPEALPYLQCITDSQNHPTGPIPDTSGVHSEDDGRSSICEGPWIIWCSTNEIAAHNKNFLGEGLFDRPSSETPFSEKATGANEMSIHGQYPKCVGFQRSCYCWWKSCKTLLTLSIELEDDC